MDIEKYGAPGSPIPGSKYHRDYCCLCGEPIRVFVLGQVVTNRGIGTNCCNDCQASRNRNIREFLGAGQREKYWTGPRPVRREPQ